MKILLVDDNDFSLELTKDMIHEVLSQDETEIVIAKNGNDAVSLFEQSDIRGIDVILMDIVMPQMSGEAAVNQIRSMNREDAETVPIIIVSALAQGTVLENEALISGYIQKPLSVDKIRTAFEQLS